MSPQHHRPRLRQPGPNNSLPYVQSSLRSPSQILPPGAIPPARNHHFISVSLIIHRDRINSTTLSSGDMYDRCARTHQRVQGRVQNPLHKDITHLHKRIRHHVPPLIIRASSRNLSVWPKISGSIPGRSNLS